MSIILLLILASPCAALHHRKCIRNENNKTLCEESEKMHSTITKGCCYDLEMDYYYCCPINEHRSMSYKSRITGSTIAAMSLILVTLLFCSFCKRCPISKIFLKRRQQPNNTQHTEEVSVERK